MVIQGPGAALLTISGDGSFGLFSVPAGVTATMTGLTLSGGGGAQSGGAHLEPGHAHHQQRGPLQQQRRLLRRCNLQPGRHPDRFLTTFTNNTATYGLGGAIDNSGTLVVASSTFTGGVAFEGGAIDNKSGTSP